MNVRCPSCQTTFRVDPDRIPASGVKARCARCASVFRLDRTGVVAGIPAGVGAPAGPGPSMVPTPDAPAPPVRQPAPAAPAPVMPPPAPPAPAPMAAPIMPPRPVMPPAPPAPAPMAQSTTYVAPQPPPAAAAPVPPAPAAPAAAETPVATSGPRRPSFRNQDPQARAQRIARALVSDIVAYNKSKLKETLQAGTLRSEFKEEIRKSWEEYVEQVGLDMAKSTPYFRDSLNEILAQGQKVF